MPTDRPLDDRISRWLEAEAPGQVPDRVLSATFERTRKTRQQREWAIVGLRGESIMNKLLAIGVGGAAVIAVLLLGPRLIGSPDSGGAGAGAPPSVEPTAPPTPSPPPAPEGAMSPGTYAGHPLPEADSSLSVAFTVPKGWQSWVGDTGVGGLDLAPTGQPDIGYPGGIFIQFLDVTTLNGDICDWSGTDDDITVGRAVDDLVEALRAQTAYEVSEPVDVTIGGFAGKRVDIVYPTELFEGLSSSAPACDDGNVRLWSTSAHGPNPLYAQGPANRWQANILDVDGTRLVIVAADFPGTLPEDRAEMGAIIDSITIEP